MKCSKSAESELKRCLRTASKKTCTWGQKFYVYLPNLDNQSQKEVSVEIMPQYWANRLGWKVNQIACSLPRVIQHFEEYNHIAGRQGWIFGVKQPRKRKKTLILTKVPLTCLNFVTYESTEKINQLKKDRGWS